MSAITVDIGSNDLLHWAKTNGLLSDTTGSTIPTLTQQQQVDVQHILTQFGKNFAQTIAFIRSYSSAPIVAYNLYDPFPAESPLHALDEQLEAVENTVIEQVAKANPNVVVADAHGAFDGNQVSDVRLAQEDVHPTVAGQRVLAQIGEQALQPFLRNLKAPHLFSGVTHLLVASVPQSGGQISGTLNRNSVSLSIPPGALNQGTEVDMTSQELVPSNQLSKLPALKHFLVTEDAVNFMSSVSFASPFTLTITNPNIPKNAVVLAIHGKTITEVASATVTQGQVSISAKQGGDFLILALPFPLLN